MNSQRQADLIVHSIDWLISVDPTRRVIRDAALAVMDGSFAAIGKSASILNDWHAENVLHARGMVATPGFVDNHLHSSFQMARGLADESNAQAFLFEHMYPYEAAGTEEDDYVSASLAAVASGW